MQCASVVADIATNPAGKKEKKRKSREEGGCYSSDVVLIIEAASVAS